jgi:hypothetical protein
MARTDYRLDITAQDRTTRAFQSVSRNLKKMRSDINSSVGRIAKVGSAFVTAGALAGAAIVKMRMQAIDNLAKTADKLGATTEALRGLQHAAEITGVSTNTMNMALQRMTRRVAEAAVGTGEAKGALQELGLNAIQLQKLPLDVQMQKIANAMGNVQSQSDRVRLAMKLFDSEGVALVNTLALGEQGLIQMAKEAEALGISISRVDAAQIEAANDSVTRATGVFEGFSNQIAVALSPAITELAANFYQVALDTNEAGNVGQRVAEALFRGFGHVANAVKGIRIAVQFVQLGFAKFVQFFLNGVAKLGSVIDWLAEKYNKIASVLGMDTIDINVGENIAMLADSFGEQAIKIQESISEALNSPLPSDQIMEWFDNVQLKARETAEVVAANAPAVAMATANNAGVKKLTFQEQAQKEGQAKLAEFNNKTQAEQTQVALNEATSRFAGIAATNKKLFAVQKAMQIGQAVMNTYTSATRTMAEYPFPLNVALAAMTVASGMAQVAQIRAQSFEGGGFTGFGARVGGVDGKGGMPAIVHPNETIIDHTKNQDMPSGGANITFNIQANDARGFDELLIKRRGMITSMVNQALNNQGKRLGR